MNEWIIKIVDPGHTITRHIYIFRHLASGITEFIKGDKVIRVEEGAIGPGPSLELSPEQLQAFADALNANGFKPQDGFIEGKLEGTERHLQDLRHLLKLDSDLTHAK